MYNPSNPNRTELPRVLVEAYRVARQSFLASSRYLRSVFGLMKMPSIISKTWEAIIGFASTELLARALPGGRWPLHWLSTLRSIAQALRGQRPRSVSRPKHPISYSMSLVRQRNRSSCRRDDKWLSS